MIFNIAMIVILVVQGLIICHLSAELEETQKACTSVFAYFQKLATDLGYPELIHIDDESRELEHWSDGRKEG